MFNAAKADKPLSSPNLDLANQRFSASSLASLLAARESVTSLNLNSNNISDQSCVELQHLLAANTTLQNVTMGFNPFTKRGSDILSQLFDQNETLLVLNGDESLRLQKRISVGIKVFAYLSLTRT